MLSLLYLMEGVVRAMSDPAPLSVAMAWGEILLSTVFFVSAIFYVRPAAPREVTRMTARTLNALTTVNSFAALPDAFYTRLAPQPLNHPRLLHANPDAAALIGLDPSAFATPEFLAVFSGQQPLPGGDTLAAVQRPPVRHLGRPWATGAHLLGEVGRPAAGSCSSRAPA